MDKSLKIRVLSIMLALLMFFSNMNIPAIGAEKRREPVNLSTQQDQTSLELTNLWYLDSDAKRQNIEATKENAAETITDVYDLSELDEKSLVHMGFDLTFSVATSGTAGAVQPSDYVEFTLPACFKNLAVTGKEETYDTCNIEQQEDNSGKIKVTFQQIPDGDTLTGTIHMTCSLDKTALTGQNDTCLFVLQEKQQDTETRQQYRLVFAKQNDQASKEANSPADNDAASPVSGVVSGNFSISGKIVYNENLDGTDWSKLLRPAEFDQPIKITQSYTDSQGNPQTVVYDAQENISKNSFYLKFSHDGEGGGDFVITNVPKSVTDAYGVECQVTSYSVSVEPTLPYYSGKTPISIPISDPSNITTSVGTLTLDVNYQTVTLHPTVVPADQMDQPAFVMKATFSNGQLTDQEESGRIQTNSYAPTKDNDVTVKVPTGISYKITQQETPGYRFDGNYSTTATTDGVAGEPSVSDQATGTIAAGTDLTISTVNYAQNVTVGFDVNWLDNQKATRPVISGDNFTLQYKTADGEWKDLTSDDYEALNLKKAPVFDQSQASLNRYAYTGLPAVDAENHPLEYQVVVKKNPENYLSAYMDDAQSGRRTITFEEQTDFHAQIVWNDISEPDARPDQIDSLKLYRKVGNGTYELVYDTLPEDAITKDDTSWSVDISRLPRYNAQNQEYDYVLVQGTIDANNNVTSVPVNEHYRTYYDNGSGTFGNDTALCHNNGSITEVLYRELDFHAQKIWKDPTGTAETRPDATVTLWRYIKGSAADIDEAYEKGIAAQVVFQTTADGKVKEDIASYQIDKQSGTEENPQDITFTSYTITGMPAGYQFPKYDDQGREYVYFVRESLAGTNANAFDIQYSSVADDGTRQSYQNGAPVNGTITNVRREKTAVDITKVWKNPSGLETIEGASVELRIRAKAEGSSTWDLLDVYSNQDGSYKILTGDAKQKAQTITGFSSSMAQGEVLYYVNAYNSEGYPYDLEHAKICETVRKGDKVYTISYNTDGTKYIDMDGQSYQVTTSFDSSTTLGNGIRQYRYTQTNTISARREYKLIKKWDTSIPDEDIANIQAVNFKLERRSTRSDSGGTAYEPVLNSNGENLWSVKTESGRTWTTVLEDLPEYDADGFAYEYRATEISFTDKDGQTISVQQANTEQQWSGEHYRTPEQTMVINRKYQPGQNGFFTISKIWQDNGETVGASETRKNVQVRIYKRSDLKDRLEELKAEEQWSENQVVDLDKDLKQLKYYQTEITSQNQYATDVYYTSLENAIDGKVLENVSQDSWKNYVVVEYSVGSELTDGATAAQYTYQQLWAAADSDGIYSLDGTVENAQRQYRTQTTFEGNNGRFVLLTNTRIGTTELQAKKTWKDENNIKGQRPDSVKFQLYQDGSVYQNIPSTVTIEQGKDASVEASLDRASGVITVSSTGANTAETWEFTLKGLDMFSASAVPHTYDLDEVTDGSAKTAFYSYSEKKVTPVVTDTVKGKAQQYTFSFENTISGTTDHIAYKYWQDAAIGTGSRPDLYMTLYRYLKKDQRENPDTPLEQLDSYTAYTDYKDQIWTTEAENSSTTDYEQGYNWKIMINDLPGFDENGNEYGYVFKESMNNDGVTVLGTYVPSVETKPVPSDGNAADTDTYEVFRNTISGYMTLQGRKTWTGLAGYQTKEEDLPDPLISLYRTTDPSITDVQSKTDAEVKQLLAEGKIKLVDTTHLTGSKASGNDKTVYHFPDNDDVSEEELNQGYISIQDGTAMLPKFDETGNRYIYLVRETIADPIAGQLYSQVNTNGTLSNVFRSDVNRRKITVQKSWSGRDGLASGEDRYPSVTYHLYRYEAGKPESETQTLIETHTISAAEFASGNGTAGYTFDDLLVYSPSGVQYCYYITEDKINGYSISYTDEPGIADGSLEGTTIATGQTSDGQTSHLTVTEDMLKTLQENQRIDIISCPAKWNDASATAEDLTALTGTTNQYDARGIVEISGKKIWNDYGNMEGLRPDKIAVTLTRHTNNESGQNNKVDPTPVTLEERDSVDTTLTKPYIVWQKGTDAKTSPEWTYTIYNLERYAPNGMPYIYTLSEGQAEGYKQADPVSQTANADKLTMPALVNQFSGSYYVRKNWMDGSNKYNLRPTSITVKLQRSTDHGQTWNDIPWKDSYGTYDQTKGTWTGLPGVIADENGEKIVSVTLTAANVIKNTKNNSWDYTFTNLPTQDQEGHPYTYRCVETAIGGVPVQKTAKQDGSVKYTAGAYERQYIMQNDTRTVMENILDDTSLVVTKKWIGDQDNLYHSRPDSLTFVLQKRGTAVRDELEGEDSEDTDSPADESELSEWNDVLNADGTPYTFTISPDANGNWTKTLEDLPTAEVQVAEDGTSYTVYSLYFRAVEIHTDDKVDASGKRICGSIAAGAQNYKDVTDYSTDDTNQAHHYNTATGQNESTITNQLILDEPAKSISVTKIWRHVTREPASATFELLYKTADEADWHCYGGEALQKTSGTDEELMEGNDWSKHDAEHHCNVQTVSTAEGDSSTITWKDLPKYDKAGKELVYKIVEHPVAGYETDIQTNATPLSYATKYTFTNIELQDYSVRKIWQNTDYAERTEKGYTATFQLQQKLQGDGNWQAVTGRDPITLTSTGANDNTQQGTWKDLPMYTVDGKEIQYRAVETQINGKDVQNDTNGAYQVSYQYGSAEHADTTSAQPAFTDTQTIATNRMIYGFVNLSKAAAYLAPEIKENPDPGNLAGVKFNIYQGTTVTAQSKPYVSDVETDENGNLIQKNGKYGIEQKYLVAGTYTLKEVSASEEYSVWANGVTFTVGSGHKNLTGTQTDTGEHGTAWISTAGIGSAVLGLQTEYLPATMPEGQTDHAIGDSCTAQRNANTAVNLESRGVVSFTKTGPKSGSQTQALDTHDGATGESVAYFGVYLDAGCTKQVAGMMPKSEVVPGSDDKTTMVLTDKTQDGSTIPALKTANQVPYLRAYENSNYENYPYTLLSGTYYIRELTAPAGYQLDMQVRKLVVKKIGSVADSTDLSDVYGNNQAEMMLPQESQGTTTYQWSNTPNQVTLYKLDQFGRKVPLSENGYLELKVSGSGNTFPSGEDTIRLYQNAEHPATKQDGSTKVNGISYDADAGAWKITGLFDIGKTYTLSEPQASVHANYIVAVPISFTMQADGRIQITDSTAGNTVQKDNPLQADGTDYNNAYRANADNNIFVMRDVSRYLKDIAVHKQDADTGAAIANISFKLYKYESKNADGTLNGEQPVLEDAVYLTTNQNGDIELKKLDDSVKNQITGCALKYGLDVGNYYLEEVERGASDQYRLADPVYFTITPKEGTNAATYEDYAEVTYETAGRNDVTAASDGKTVIIKDTHVTVIAKTLQLSKVDSENTDRKLANAKFTLSYTSINHGHAGSATGDDQKELSWNCITDDQGVLYLTDTDGSLPADAGQRKQPDISRKGSYTLKETQAPDGYMTRTEDGTSHVVTMITFDVNSDNQIVNVKYYDGTGHLVTSSTVTKDDATGEHLYLDITVKNEKTKVSVAKRSDIIADGDDAGTKSCDQNAVDGELLSGAKLEIFEGTDTTDSSKKVATLEQNQSEWNWITPQGVTAETGADLPAGCLKENTIYTLHESSAPIGYLAADDIYFKLSGTTTENNEVIAQLYVWTGSAAPTALTGANWSQQAHLNHQVLTMTDEAIIAPVDLQKVMGANGIYDSLAGAKFEVKAGDVTLGTAKSGENGYLVWNIITADGYASGLIFNADGKRVTSADADSVIGKTMILQQNAAGYTVTETDAPDQAYNDGRTYHVVITAENYKQYCQKTQNGFSYATEQYINLVEAEQTTDHQVKQLTARSTQTAYKNETDAEKTLAVNAPYRSTVTLHKYDGDEEGQKAAIPGTEFTLYRDRVSDATVYKKAFSGNTQNTTGVFTTDQNGNLSIEIPEKGTYILKETKAATGYQSDEEKNTFTFTLTDRQTENSYGYNQTNQLMKNVDGVPNERLTGSVSLTKQDDQTHEKLNGVVYTLSRTDVPKASPGDTDGDSSDLTDYLLKNPVQVVTGKSYEAVKENGQWKLKELTDPTQCKTGEIHISGLNWGSYILTETTENSGYKLEQKEDGTARNTHSFTIDGRSNALSFSYTDTNTKNSITFYKTNQVDPEAGITVDGIRGLPGAVFEVHEGPVQEHEENCQRASFYTSATEQQKATRVTTGADGKVTIYGLPTDIQSDTPKVYHLVEVQAPKGYKLQTKPVTFTVDRQGKVQILNTSGNYEDADPSGQVTMTDEAIKLYLQKLGEHDTVKLSGANFVLKDVCTDSDCDHKLANGSDSETITIPKSNTDGKIMIPLERVIGGHTYQLVETKAPDGYESTAVVTFHVQTDGTIDTITSEGGYRGITGREPCASTDSQKTTISIKDERIGMTLTKVDAADENKKLAHVTFTLKPYGTVSDGPEKGQPSAFTANYNRTGLSYDPATDTYTFVTDANGQITFPTGLMRHDNSYLLQETATQSGYYLSNEAKAGVILKVGKDGGITVERLAEYEGKTVTAGDTVKSSCPVSVATDGSGNSSLISRNPQATSFDLTKLVTGNMGDHNGIFKINMEVYEPDGTLVGKRSVKLSEGQKYDSETGLADTDSTESQAFGAGAIPVGATLVLKEDDVSGYTAVVRITSADGTGSVLSKEQSDKGTAKVTLNTPAKVSIELTNQKDAVIDVGVHSDRQAPLAAVTLLIPAAWLTYRYRRKRRGGER